MNVKIDIEIEPATPERQKVVAMLTKDFIESLHRYGAKGKVEFDPPLPAST